MYIHAHTRDVLLAGVLGATVILSASTVAAQCNEERETAEYAEVVHSYNDVVSRLGQTQIEYQSAPWRHGADRAKLIAEKERAWDVAHEDREAASECRIKMNEVYGDPGWPVSDPIPVDRYMWVWELACGPWPGPDTTCMTCLDDLRDAQDIADMWMEGCKEVRQEDIQAACKGTCAQARAAKGRYRRELEISENNGEYWSAEALKLREKYEPDRYKLEADTDG
jgi:hypothetical protein